MKYDRTLLWGAACAGALALTMAGQVMAGRAAAGDSGITGVWQVSTAQGTAVLMLNPDGSGEFNGGEIHWTFEHKILTVAESTTTTMYNTVLAGDSLTLSGANLRAPITFKRVGSGSGAQDTVLDSSSNSGGGLAAVSGGASSVTGTWQVQNASGTFTLVLDAGGSGKFNNDRIRWQFNRNVLTLSWENGTTYVYNTSLSGDSLTVSGGNLSQPISFHRLGGGGGSGGLAAAAGPPSRSAATSSAASGPAGEWETVGPNGMVRLVLRPDGSGQFGSGNVRWNYTQNLLSLTGPTGKTITYTASFAGDTMTLNDPAMGGPVVFRRPGGGTAAADGSETGSTNSWNPSSGQPHQPSSATALNGTALNSLAANVKNGLKRDKPETVLAQGDPPLTHASVAAFAEIMRLAFETELTETEFAQTAQLFVAYYQNGNAEKKKLLATTYQQVLEQMTHGTPEQQATATAQARETLGKQFAAGAQAGNPFALLCYSAIQRRQTMIATIPGPVPEFARQAGLHNQMSLADLDASVEMLYFMWVAAGRDPRLVTSETVITVRAAIAQNFPAFPPQLQYWFANGQKMYDAMRGEYAQAGRVKKLKLAFQYSGTLDQLGLTVQAAQGGGPAQSGGGRSNNAWADVGGQSHSAWAADMVQGLAGSSYHSSW